MAALHPAAAFIKAKPEGSNLEFLKLMFFKIII
jgi:hypothetical protein